MLPTSHRRLVLPGPVEVRRELLDAQAGWMIGHRTTEFETLFARVQEHLRRVFFTEQHVFASVLRERGFGRARRAIVCDPGDASCIVVAARSASAGGR